MLDKTANTTIGRSDSVEKKECGDRQTKNENRKESGQFTSAVVGRSERDIMSM